VNPRLNFRRSRTLTVPILSNRFHLHGFHSVGAGNAVCKNSACIIEGRCAGEAPTDGERRKIAGMGRQIAAHNLFAPDAPRSSDKLATYAWCRTLYFLGSHLQSMLLKLFQEYNHEKQKDCER
jgi:hypothetical protein